MRQVAIAMCGLQKGWTIREARQSFANMQHATDYGVLTGLVSRMMMAEFSLRISAHSSALADLLRLFSMIMMPCNMGSLAH